MYCGGILLAAAIEIIKTGGIELTIVGWVDNQIGLA